MSENKKGPDADVSEQPASQVGETPASEGLRIFIIGCVLGTVINCFLAFGFFLAVEDSPRMLLKLEIFQWLTPSLFVEAILIGLALLVRRDGWRLPVGFALAMLIILALTANWVLTSHPIPSQEEKCAALREVYAVLEEGKTINASTPAEEAKAWRSKLVTVWKKNFKTLQFALYLPSSRNIDLRLKEFEALEGREKTGIASITIRSKINAFEDVLEQHIVVTCPEASKSDE